MDKWLINMVIISGLFALQPVRLSINENINIKKNPIPTIHVPVVTKEGDTLTTAFINNPGKDFQACCGATSIRLWAVEELGGTYANMIYEYPDGRRQATNFFDWHTNTWIGDTDGYDTTGLRRGNDGNLAINYSDVMGYQYHFFVTFFSYDYDYQPDVQWPDTPFTPTNPNPTYKVCEGGDTMYLCPRIGFTREGYLHQISTDYRGASGIQFAIMYNRSTDYTTWDGLIPIVNTGDGPFYGLYADPFSNRVVVTYCRVSSDMHIIMFVDTMSGDMFYQGMPLQVDVSQEIYNQTGTQYYIGFVGDGNPFVDRDGNIHLITFGWDGSNDVPVEIYHFFWDLKADTFGIHFIKQFTDFYYPRVINSLVAGRSQMGQDRDNGVLYAIWEEFIQEPGRFVVSSTDDTLAPTRIVMAQSLNNGITWTEAVLLESDQIRDNNDWLRFPVISPVIPKIGSADVVYWGVYDDDDPGFEWQGQGDVSWVAMLVGRKEYVNIEETSFPSPFNISLNYMPNPANGRIKFYYHIPEKSFVSFKVFDISGKLVKVLVKGMQEPGNYEINWVLKDIPSGTYISVLKTDKRTLRRKIVVMP